MLDELEIKSIIKKIISEIDMNETPKTSKNESFGECTNGICCSIDSAIKKAHEAQKKYNDFSLDKRKKIINALRKELSKFVEKISKETVLETKMGRVKDKILKNTLVIEGTPGVEDLETKAFTGDDGLTLVELSAFGVIGALTPVTNATETIIGNTIGAIAGGNSVVFCPHPSAVKISLWLIEEINKIIVNSGGPENLITVSKEFKKENVDELFSNEKISLLVITGGTDIVKLALKSGKKVIGAGAGNPPVIVDETANIEKAALDILNGASLDNNLPCIAEKEVLVIDSVADFLIFNMQKNGALHLTDPSDIEKLEKVVFIDGKLNKALIGKDASVILDTANIKYEFAPLLITLEAKLDHCFVQEELMMPVLPIVRQNNFEEALENAILVEHGLRHTAVMHSQNVTRLSIGARRLQTTIFVKNAPSYAAIGFNGEGYTTFTIAGPTGEGLTSAKDFTRKRRCVLSGSFSIR